MREKEVRPVKPAQLQRAVDVIANAFAHDPTWTWAFPEPSKRKRFLALFVEAGMRFPSVFSTEGFEAVSIWTPPGESEFTPEQEAAIPTILSELAGTRAPDVIGLLSRFAESHPQTESHYYLGLLGVDPTYQGRGLGMTLLKEHLKYIDAQKMPVYLESSNPANNNRYEALGFKVICSFQAPANGPTVTGMWRDTR